MAYLGDGPGSVVTLHNSPYSQDAKVAIKHFHRRRDEPKSDFLPSVKNEYRILSALDHPNIGRAFHLFEDHSSIANVTLHQRDSEQNDLRNFTWHMVMEHAPYDLNLGAYFGPMSALEIQCVFAQLISALRYLHTERRIAHGDMKTSNVLLEKTDANRVVVKLIDFGSAIDLQAEDDHRGKEFIIGSPPFQPPESYEKSLGRDITPQELALKADIWGLGIIYLDMHLGRLPWKTSDPANKEFAYFMSHRRQLLAQLPDEISVMLGKMLQPNPKRRASIEAFANLGKVGCTGDHQHTLRMYRPKLD
ncbi:MAG: hypothetical protein Q9227_009165 [Pyrenula ochraceoflavens]